MYIYKQNNVNTICHTKYSFIIIFDRNINVSSPVKDKFTAMIFFLSQPITTDIRFLEKSHEEKIF